MQRGDGAHRGVGSDDIVANSVIGERQANLRDEFLPMRNYATGAGVLFDFSERVTGRIVIGQPLRGNPAELHDKRPRAHVSINIALN